MVMSDNSKSYKRFFLGGSGANCIHIRLVSLFISAAMFVVAIVAQRILKNEGEII